MRTETKALKRSQAKCESDVAGLSPLLRASGHHLMYYGRNSARALSANGGQNLQGQGHKEGYLHTGKFHLPCLEIFPRGLSFGLTYYLVGFIFGLVWFVFVVVVFFLKLIRLKKNWNSRYVYYDGKKPKVNTIAGFKHLKSCHMKDVICAAQEGSTRVNG